ncbi:MAG: hypothetical protein IT309_03230 [Anaerolineales bacterium]|jgi:hypothetical protein|nr:hypothetical protein [Chloroflexota bacterium]MCC6985416.1 hypothetical protein [Anaerolineales bacterium]
MKLKHVFYLQAFFGFLPGLGFLFAPAVLWNAWGTPSEGAVMDLAGRNTGVFLLTVGLIALFAAQSDDSPLRRNITLAYVVLHGVGFVIYALPLLTGGVSFGSAWIMSLIFALAFAYFRFVKSNE